MKILSILRRRHGAIQILEVGGAAVIKIVDVRQVIRHRKANALGVLAQNLVGHLSIVDHSDEVASNGARKFWVVGEQVVVGQLKRMDTLQHGVLY